MQVAVSPSEDSRAKLDISLTGEEVDAVIEATYRRVAQRIKVPGFRPGKAPRQLVVRTFGEEPFYHQATDELLREWYPKALAESGVEAVDQGDLDLPEDVHVEPGQPFTFSALVTTKPEVALPDYRAIKVEPPSTEVSDGDVDKVIESIRTSRATLEPAPAKSAEIGDVVKMNINGRAGGDEVLNEEDFNFELTDEAEEPDKQLPGLSKELVGSRPGDIREAVLTLPPDYRDQELGGKSLSLRLVVKEVLRKVLPELTDELAADISSADSVAGLRDLIRHNLEHEKHDEATGTVATQVVDALIAQTELTLPDVMIEEEQDRLLSDQRRYFERQGMKFDQLLMAMRKSEDEYRDELRPAAERRVKRNLILEAVARKESLEPPEDEVDEELRQMAKGVAQSERDIERLQGSASLRDTIRKEMVRRLALALLVESSSDLKPLQHDHDDSHHEGDAVMDNEETRENGAADALPVAAGATAEAE